MLPLNMFWPTKATKYYIISTQTEMKLYNQKTVPHSKGAKGGTNHVLPILKVDLLQKKKNRDPQKL